MSRRQDQADMRVGIMLGNTAINAMYDELARAVGVAVVAHSERSGLTPTLTPRSHAKIMRDVDDALDVIFPRRRGGPSLLEEAVVAQSQRVGRKPVAHAIAEIETEDAELAAAIRKDVGE